MSGTTGGGSPYDALILQTAQQYNLPPDVFRRLVGAESGFNPNAVSPKGATGLTQLMPGTARGLGVDPTIPEQNIQGGGMYLRQMLNMFQGDLSKAVAAYNWGPGNVRRFGMSNLPRETQGFVAQLIGRSPPVGGGPGAAPVVQETAPAPGPPPPSPTPGAAPGLAALFTRGGTGFTMPPRGRPLFPVYDDSAQDPYSQAPFG